MTSHLEDGTIHELLDGEIPSAELPPIQVHLARCAECRARLDAARLHVAEADELIDALDALDAPGQPAIVLPVRGVAHQDRAWIRQLAWAASIAGAVGTGYYARGGVGPLVGSAPVAVGETGSEAARTSAPLSQLPVGDGAREQKAGDATRSTPVTAPSVTASRDVGRSDAPAAGRASTPPSARAEVETRQRVGGNFADKLPIDRNNNVAALQPGVMASPTEAVAPSANAPARLARGTRPEVASRDQAASKQAAVDTIPFEDAVRLLGGRLRLIEGLVPVRLESIGREVRVIYPLAQGELVLAQSVVDGVPIVRLIAPTGFSADSLAVLRRKVQ